METNEDIDQLLRARSDIDEELRRHKTKQTVLFTDIVGSTTYFDHFGDTAGLVLLYRHDSVVVGAIEEFDGIVIKTIGDSVMAQFVEPSHAVHAAIAMQRRLLQHNRSLSRSERLQIRIGINSGYGFRRANDLFGDSVNVAARITKRCGPAQILISQSVFEETPAVEATCRSLGKMNLAGKTDALEIYEVVWAEEGAYDALRSSLTGFERDSLKRFRAMRSRLSQTIGVVSAKTAAIIAIYLVIAAGLVASRADTKRSRVPDIHVSRVSRQPVIVAENVKEVVSSPEPLQPAAAETAESAVSTSSAPANVIKLAVPAPDVTPIPNPAPQAVQPDWMGWLDTVPIPAGTFMMGNESGKGDEKPRHQVKLDGLNMSRAEITNRQYWAFLEATGYPRPKDPGFVKNYLMDYPDLPVINVSYEDAIAFCAWASTKFEAAIRLPTEAEWEYASLGGETGGPFPWGDKDPKAMARFKGNAGRGVVTVSKGTFPPNGYGLYNMNGNVWEWVLDFYAKDYYTTSPIRNPKGADAGTKRSIRGGSWADDEQSLFTTRRANRSPGDHSDQIGFRVVVTLVP
jgi:formylglycine-generating enzyme required for sulfatase activity/class 3 adenylate cyclase